MKYSIREAGVEDLPDLHDLIDGVFDTRVASHYSKEGIKTFKGHIELIHLIKSIKKNYWVLLAEDENGVVLGTIFIKNRNQINLFFVRTEHERRGIGRALLDEVLKRIMEDDPDVTRITVSSSPNSVEAYRKLGFEPTDYEKILHGIRYTPMELIIR